jgi:hypothetical protein
LQVIGVLEKPRSVANIQVCNLTHVSTLEREKNWDKYLDLWAENGP